MRQITVNANDEGQRLDKFVQKTVWGMPLSLVYKFIRTKRIKVNGKKSDHSYRLKLGDVVSMFIPDDFSRPEVSVNELYSSVPTLSVVYEDDNLLICDKPAGVLVHPGDEGEHDSDMISERGTLLFDIKCYLAQKGEYLPENENSFAPALCNRIDRNTGGLVISAKNAPALRNMNEEIKNGGVVKKYICAAHGKFPKEHDILRAYLIKDPALKKVRITDICSPGSKSVVTEYKVIDYNKELDLSLLEVTLHTGRTHQIRAHLAYEGHPLLGDGKYAENKADRAAGWNSQALYSYSLYFDPTTEFFAYLGGKEITAPYDSISFLNLFDR